MVPPEVIDYHIVNGVACNKVSHHGKVFWHIVCLHVSGYEERAQWLEEHGAEPVFFVNALRR